MSLRALRALRRRLDTGAEDGIALITVMLVSMVALALLAAVSTYAVSSMKLSRRDQDWGAALAATEAGIDDFVLRLNLDQTWDDKALSSTAMACSASPTTALARCSTWANVPGSTVGAQFQYSVESIASSGTTLVTSGRVRNVTRAVKTLIKRTTFLDYAYFSDRETSNPAYFDTPDWTAAQIAAENTNHWCDAYWFQGSTTGQERRELHSRTADPANVATRVDTKPCDVTEFSTSDLFNGPVRTNDVLFFQGNATFDANSHVSIGRPKDATVTPSSANVYGQNNFWINTKPDYPASSGVVPNFNGGISYEPPIELPPDNSALRYYAENPVEGCRYFGPTRIELTGTKVQVWSPLTQTSDVPSDCSLNGTSMDYPAGNDGTGGKPSVIYVADDERGSACNSETTFPKLLSTHPWNPLSTSDYNNSGYNQATATKYVCGKGIAFVGGTYDGQLTVGAADKIVVWKDVKRSNTTTSSNDVLGLLPNDSVEMWHPVTAQAGVASRAEVIANTALPDEVDAAILCVNGSWKAENYHSGTASGTYTVTGTLAQRYRGRMAQSPYLNYTKKYVYDSRYKTLSPPHFLDPQRAAWGVVNWGEQKPP
jgi:hypothetical protein